MEFRTIVDIPDPGFRIEPCERMLFVGSCFADSIGARFREEGFPVTVNPYGTMYNPASVLHTIERWTTQGVSTQGGRNDVSSAMSHAFLTPCVVQRSMVWRTLAGLYIVP